MLGSRRWPRKLWHAEGVDALENRDSEWDLWGNSDEWRGGIGYEGLSHPGRLSVGLCDKL